MFIQKDCYFYLVNKTYVPALEIQHLNKIEIALEIAFEHLGGDSPCDSKAVRILLPSV